MLVGLLGGGELTPEARAAIAAIIETKERNFGTGGSHRGIWNGNANELGSLGKKMERITQHGVSRAALLTFTIA
jgi:hypothetical protein